MQIAENLADSWRSRLQVDCPNYDSATYESIVSWLLGKDLERYETLTPAQLIIAEQAMDYRYRILRHRYLEVGPERAYRNLISRLGSLVMLRNKIKTWVALSRDRQRAVVDVLQEVIQELLNSDRYLQEQIGWIAQSTSDSRLRNALLLASTEEYCLRPIRNQPLLLYRFVNYLRRSGRGGITQVPTGDLVRLVSEEVMPDDAENPVSLLDAQAIALHQEKQALEEKMAARSAVKQEFEHYLTQNLGQVATDWLKLYLQGRSQEEIARALNKPIKEIYRLREKISYHAIRVFGLKVEPELVANWLETSLQEHRLGLTPTQWQEYKESLTDEQRRLLDKLATGKTLEAIAQDLNLKTNQVMGEWSKLYLAAQEKRSAS
ncbi:HetZ-related protein 2 [Planktothrix sp. FACHB-1355]|uniref:HetZ-related protein 2 n=1 Tax=Aerosakkonema funiforme FACHB-1375 TaxID=2949571 RepID=A0A926VJI5_9CYAN|nr:MULTISPECIES: HetZ-related protein 2 [Oscillatoriales]MBD2183882.1 HetZ-related protein 2 [Aerosakkonema funiforme FACHB-1375]MBD3560829.1 HetZ-related protein 2 [Planktothrix sp. FACHB-1355]